MWAGEGAESGAVPGDCRARLLAAAAIHPDSGEAGGDRCCGREAPGETGEPLGNTDRKFPI